MQFHRTALWTELTTTKKVKSFREHMDPQGGADLHIHSRQPDTNLYWDHRHYD